MDTLKFSTSNQKMKDTADLLVNVRKNSVMSFDIPAGYTCPAADLCLAKADRETGKLQKGSHMQFLCYAARIENQRSNVRVAHWFNFDLIKNAGLNNPSAMADLIIASIPQNARIIRIHSSGDLFNGAYYTAWKLVAKALPHVIFFGYTKMFAMARDNQECKPHNLFIVYSYGGRDDEKAVQAGLAMIKVVDNRDQAAEMGLPECCSIYDDFDQDTKDRVTAILDGFGIKVDHWNGHANDFFAVLARISFAIVVH